jgi:hypothetical protein
MKHALEIGTVDATVQNFWTSRLSQIGLAFALLVSLTLMARAQSAAFPRLAGKTLSAKEIVLPDDARGKIALVAIGFSKKSGEVTRAWGDRFKKDFGADPNYAVYPVAMLEEAPRFVRGMILGSMRRGIPVGDRDRFVTLFQGEAELKHFVAFSAADDAYLFLLDAKGEVQWRGHGVFREEDYPALQTAARKLASP